MYVNRSGLNLKKKIKNKTSNIWKLFPVKVCKYLYPLRGNIKIFFFSQSQNLGQCLCEKSNCLEQII